MQLDCPIRNGKPQPHAAAGTLARFAHAIKRLKDMLQLGIGDARAMIADRHNRVIEPRAERNFNGSAFRRVTNGIANYVFNSAAQEL